MRAATEELQDVAQRIQYIGLTAEEITTLFAETEAESAMQSKSDNSKLKSVTFPSNLLHIGAQAFEGCDLENVKLPKKFDFHRIRALSYESREKLNRYQPETLGQASRISGISPADINVLAIFLGR